MILSSFRYSTACWELTEMGALKQANLIVGKNASGKTRTINALKSVTSFLQMKPKNFLFDNEFRAELSFTDPDNEAWKMTYTFEITESGVNYEELTVNGETIVKRDPDSSIIKGQSINPPTDKLVVQVRRDRDAYPEIEDLMEWAEGVVAISCSNLNPFTLFPASVINPMPLSELVDSLGSDDKDKVIEQAQTLGYDLKSISILQPGGDLKLVVIEENDINSPILDFQLSSGMLRVLYMLFFLANMYRGKKYSMILVDDLGEGLDYKRATLLGKIIFDSCRTNKVQLIASSNDSFLMDVIDLSMWQILRRHKSRVSTINNTNTPELFDEFSMTGLSNFDLFSSDFIDNFLCSHNK